MDGQSVGSDAEPEDLWRWKRRVVAHERDQDVMEGVTRGVGRSIGVGDGKTVEEERNTEWMTSGIAEKRFEMIMDETFESVMPLGWNLESVGITIKGIGRIVDMSKVNGCGGKTGIDDLQLDFGTNRCIEAAIAVKVGLGRSRSLV